MTWFGLVNSSGWLLVLKAWMAPAQTVSGTLAYASITFTDGAQIDSIAAGELFRFKLSRFAASGGDSMTIGALVYGVEMKEP